MSMLKPAIVSIALLCSPFASPQDKKPDVLELDNGRLLKGEFMGAGENKLKFRTAKGVQEVPRESCVRLHFGRADDLGSPEGKGNPRAQAEAERRRQQQQGQGGQQQQGKMLTIPAGTPISVTMDMQVLGSDPPGGFVNGMVASNVKAGGRDAIPRGSRVFGRVLETGDRIRMEFTEINIWGESYSIHTTTQAGETRSRGNAGAAGAASGALIGQRVDGSSGWNNGAWVGAFIGRAVGNNMQSYDVVVEAGSIVEFRLNRPLRVKQQ